MKQSINESQFHDTFVRMNREENFSYEGRKALFEYLEQLGEDCGQEVDLDVIALCCDYSEYESLADFQKAYSDEYQSISDIEDKTTVIKIDDDKFIIQNF
jgi:hypothetical protein